MTMKHHLNEIFTMNLVLNYLHIEMMKNYYHIFQKLKEY